MMKKDTDHTYTLTLRVHNRPGVLVRCAQIYGRRGHNIEALHVAPDAASDISTMTITAFGQAHMMDQIVAQLRKLIDVQNVTEKED
jgi:acetolactate synthase-1/3 small subunit